MITTLLARLCPKRQFPNAVESSGVSSRYSVQQSVKLIRKRNRKSRHDNGKVEENVCNGYDSRVMSKVAGAHRFIRFEPTSDRRRESPPCGSSQHCSSRGNQSTLSISRMRLARPVAHPARMGVGSFAHDYLATPASLFHIDFRQRRPTSVYLTRLFATPINLSQLPQHRAPRDKHRD